MNPGPAIAPAVRKFVAPLAAWALIAIAASYAVALETDGEPVLRNRRDAELRIRSAALGTSAVADTVYVGFTPGHSANNWWSIWSGHGIRRPPAQAGMWGFEPPYADVHGDTLQGWWSVRQPMSGTGGLTIADHLRPWRAIDYGNVANHGFGTSPTKRTFGVIGVWHVDGGNSIAAPFTTTWTGEPVSSGGVGWAPLAGAKSAWMGLRRHGDTTHSDPITKNPFNEDVLVFDGLGSTSTGGSDKKFPGYGTQMDQMLYRDINVASLGANDLTIGFKYQTELSTGFGTTNSTRSGWFVHDPLTVITGGSSPNYIRNDPDVASASAPPPTDSLMVYVGAPAEGSVLLSDGQSHAIYDAQRRWFGEVIRSNEGLYREILTQGGNSPNTTASVTIPNATVTTLRAGGQLVRLVFRVKTNHTFDDETRIGGGYSSNGRGAAQVDDVTVDLGSGPVTIGDFEAVADIDNATGVSALAKWKSTGKPPQPYHHIHQLTPDVGLVYEDICGQAGNPARVCNMEGQIVSAGDHDHSERSGFPIHSSPESEPFQGLFSPVINLAASGATLNNMGLDQDDAAPTDDYYIDYELYTGIFDFFNQGNAWRFGFQSYPAGNSSAGAGEHAQWGTVRFPSFIYMNPDKQCFRNLDGVRSNGLLRTTNPSGNPDSCRIYVGTRQECYRFGITQTDWEDGAYWDNISLAIVDGGPASLLTTDIWHWIHDTFPANDTPGLAGNAVAFDTTTALIKSGLNIAPASGNTSRFDVPGDTTVVTAEGDSVRVDLVFRILPGPGSYVNASIGANSKLRAVPTSTAPIPTPASGVANFWSNYMFSNGAKGSSGGHPIASGGPLAGQQIWSPHVWNSARMDTAELNVFQLHKRAILQPANSGLFMTTYHETELASPHRGVLGIARNVCFVADTAQTMAVTTVICGSGAMPPGVSYPPAWTGAPGSGFNGSTVTKEGTKIIPDGLLTPGAHVQYFIRREDLGTAAMTMCPDTTRVYPQPCEGSEDGHRWQQFGVLPDRWKHPGYTHPVLGGSGNGMAAMLTIDQADRRGDERAWVGVADTIGATASNKRGAHNGWYAPATGDVNNPANFVRRHIGQAGSTWDLFNVKAAESLNSGSGSLGSRGGNSAYSFNNPVNTQINGKTSRQGPSAEMLEAYYKILFFLSADLNSSVWGPFNNKSQHDVKVVQDFLLSGNSATPDRGLFAEGDGFVEALDGTSNETFNFMTGVLGVELRNTNYIAESGNTAFTAKLLATAEIDQDGNLDQYLLDNVCSNTLDVLDRAVGLAGETAEASFYEPVGANAPYIAGVVKHHTASHPWISLADGFGINRLRATWTGSTQARQYYYRNVFRNVFNSIADIGGPPCFDCYDVPPSEPSSYLRLANNASQFRLPELRFGLTKAERVSVRLYDVAGRHVRTLADRQFPAGEHVVPWDGLDRSGAQVARGVYFLKVVRGSGDEVAQKVVLLK